MISPFYHYFTDPDYEMGIGPVFLTLMLSVAAKATKSIH